MAITTILQGGMGNQMFQYAMGLAQARRLKTELVLDTSRIGGKRPFNLGQWSLTQLMMTTRQEPTVVERGMPYNQEIVDSIKDGDVLQGYWQSESYFRNIVDELCQIFKPFAPLSERAKRLEAEIKREGSVAVHVRRGDYLIEPHKSFHGILDAQYYQRAMTGFMVCCDIKPRFFIFTDDYAWCINQFTFMKNAKVVMPGREAEDIYLGSLCQHAVIANSSFSWWMAWLGDAKLERGVVAPKKWFDQSGEDYSDIVPNRWLKI